MQCPHTTIVVLGSPPRQAVLFAEQPTRRLWHFTLAEPAPPQIWMKQRCAALDRIAILWLSGARMTRKLSLAEAIDCSRLGEFIAQEEARGVGPISEAEFNDAASKVIRTEQSDDQTSGSPRRDGLREK